MVESLELLRFAVLPGVMIAIYFGFLKVGHKVGERHTISSNRTEATGIKEVILTNLKDRSTPVFALYAVHGNVVIKLIEFDDPIVLKSYDSIKIEIPSVSQYLVDGKPFDFTAMAEGRFVKTQIYYATIGKFKKCLPLSSPSHLPKTLMHGRQLAMVIRNTFNNRIYSDNVIYIIEYKINGILNDAFVDAAGFIHWELSPNGIPEDILGDAQVIADSLLNQMKFVELLAIRKTHGWNRRFGIQEPFNRGTVGAPVLGKRNVATQTTPVPK